jgi:hypothetical protein
MQDGSLFTGWCQMKRTAAAAKFKNKKKIINVAYKTYYKFSVLIDQ